MSILLAGLVIEKPPLDWSGLGGACWQWVQDAGLYAVIWLLVLALAYSAVPEFRQRSPWSLLHNIMAVVGGLAIVLFLCFLFVWATQDMAPDPSAPKQLGILPSSAPAPKVLNPTQQTFLGLAGVTALIVCSLPLVIDLCQRRIVIRRIWAIAKVAIKEAWSRGIVWVCLIIPAIYLYADYYISARPEDQLRNRVGIAYFSMAILFVFSAVLLGAFSIPADLKNQNIFTIVTKPVERYEIVLGRFLGYAVLLLAQLAVLTGISYVYVVRGLAEQAAQESFHARVPLFANDLFFHNTGKRDEGQNVGREWGYRSYITGATSQAPNPQYAVWAFDHLPAALADRPEDQPVRVEFSFDIFRTTTGVEGKRVLCSFTVAAGELTPEQVENRLKLIAAERADQFATVKAANEATGKRGPELDALNNQSKKEIYWRLFETHGVYQIQTVGVTDYQTQTEEVPAKVFGVLAKMVDARGTTRTSDKTQPAFQVLVNVESDDASRSQRVGMAKADLFLLVEDRPFWINFFKGAICIYLISCVVLGLAVVCSTYLSGIVSLLMASLLCIGGLFLPFIKALASGQSWEGGPGASVIRLATKQTASVPLDAHSTTVSLALMFDSAFRWWLRFISTSIPDVGKLYPADYVANGFDITWGQMLLLNQILPALGYLMPWALLGYYLMKSREVANP